MHKGIFDGGNVQVKKMRVYSQGNPEALEVQSRWCSFFLGSCLLTHVTVILPRGRHVEARQPPKHCSVPWCYCRPLPARFGLDGMRYKRVFGDATKGRSTRSCTYPPHFTCQAPGFSIVFQLKDVAEALYYLHSRNMVHGGITGVCALQFDVQVAELTLHRNAF